MLIFAALALAQAVTMSHMPAFANLGIDRVDSNITTHPTGHAPTAQSSLLDHFEALSDASSDLQEWGDSIHADPNELHRIYFENIDGLRNDADEMDLYVSSMAQF